MINFIASGLVIAGTCVLIGALIPVRHLILQLSPGRVRRSWYLFVGLISFFIVGYIIHVLAFWGHNATWRDIIVPVIFFFGAGFVLLTTVLSLQTATDVRRVTLLEHESISDPLIGIYNRRYLDRRLKEECSRAQRCSLPLSVLLIDIDHFKLINDTNGHQAGDLVLSNLGKLLLQVIRKTDIATRYGGDEILIIAPNTSAPIAVTLAERLRQHVETHELVFTDASNKPQNIRITVSIGVAEVNKEVADCQELIKNADEALYHAKQGGRNRIIMHDIKASKA